MSANARRAILVTTLVVMFGLTPDITAQDPGWPDGVPPGSRLIEGDIIVPDLGPRASYATNLWPGGVVPYAFDPGVTAGNQAAARDAMDEWEARAEVTFVLRTVETDYVLIRTSTVNSSFVGRVGGSQNLNIVSWNNKFIICHELAHALGVWHEQSRADRDSYVQVNTGNIQPGFEHNFDIRPNGGDHGPYDFESVMHYKPCAFSTCCPSGCVVCTSGCETIEPLPQYAAALSLMGQTSYLSLGDAQGMGFLYGFLGPDCNGNHVRDGFELSSGSSPDCNGNLVPDDCDPDCNGNGTPDDCDLIAGSSQDQDNNQVPDECDGVPAIIRVDTFATGTGDGTSWANAYTDLQAALSTARAAPGVVEEIWVAAGTYAPAGFGGPRNESFVLIDTVSLYGGFDGTETARDDRDPAANLTILSGDLNGDDGPAFTNRSDNSSNVVFSEDTAAPSAVLDGFVVRGGNADGFFLPFTTDHSGGGMNAGGDPTIRNCWFDDNSANIVEGAGGGFFVRFESPRVINCRFTGNQAAVGGGIYNYFGSPIVTGSAFSGNEATLNAGGGMATLTGYPIVTNCSFHGNTAVTNGGGYAHFSGVVSPTGVSVLSNCISWGNTDSGGTDESAQVSLDGGLLIVNHSCVEGLTVGLGGTGNIGGDPLFVDASNGDLRLAQGSPCIDAADNNAVPSDATDIDHDADSTERLPLDADGLPRFHDDIGTADTGLPDGVNEPVDMGAYEFQAATCSLLGDVNTDTSVNGSDVQNFVECLAYGTTSGNCGCADMDGLNGPDVSDISLFVSLLLAP